MSIAKGMDADGGTHDSNFLPANSDTLGATLDPRELLELCVAEHERRMGGYDPRLLRPTLVPPLVSFALRFMKKRGA